MAEPGSISHKSGLVLSLLTVWCLAVAGAAVPAVPAAGGKVRHFQWDVEYMLGAPDCEERVVMAVDGQFPGPTIRARAGDIIHVDLTNKLTTEGVVIHWHGIRQLGTPWADGTALISQCPIAPGETFTYRFVVDKPGTYFYHGHYGMQRSAGLYGSLIVDVAEGEEEPFQYDGEFNLLFSDWWHRSAQDQEVDLSSNPLRWIGEPQSLLINGRGQFNCSLAPGFGNASTTACKFRGTEQCAPQILRVRPNKLYRIRLASTASLSALNFQIQGHKLVVVEADGNYLEPFTVDDVDIYSGETYSILLSTHNQTTTSNYWVSVGVRARQPKTPPALTLLNYLNSPVSLPSSAPPATPLWNNLTHSKSFSAQILGLDGTTDKPPRSADRRVVLLNTQNKVDGFTKWAINNVSLSLPPTPYLGSIKFRLQNAFDLASPPENFPASYDITQPPPNPNATVGNGVYRIRLNTTVDIILQNANALSKNTSEIHPWHLHGHDFWVLGYGEGKFNGDEDMEGLNLENPPLRNTVVIYPFGWTALRYVADNPGVWAFHCHIEPHDSSEDSEVELCCICFEQACTIQVEECGHQMCAHCTLALCCQNSKPSHHQTSASSNKPPLCPFCRCTISQLVVARMNKLKNDNDVINVDGDYDEDDCEVEMSPSSKPRRSKKYWSYSEGSSSFKGLSAMGSLGKMVGIGSGKIAAECSREMDKTASDLP